MSGIKLKTAGGGSVTLQPENTGVDVTLTVPADNSMLVSASDLAAGTGASLVGYTPAGTGAVATTVQSKLRETVSVLDFIPDAERAGIQSGNSTYDCTVNIQNALNYCGGAYPKTLQFPSGVYLISSPLIIPNPPSGHPRIVGAGAWLKASGSGFTDFMLKAETTTYSGNNLTIEGLILDGNFTAKGILLKFAQEWSFSTVSFWNCMVAIQLRDTYYGEISNDCMIRNCLTGLQMGNQDAGEINTINIDNLKINFGTAKTNFVPKNAGESDTDYNIRVPSIGVDIRGITLGVKYRGLTCEGMDYGFYGVKTGSGLFGGIALKFAISECYFESIKVSPISLRKYSGFYVPSGLSCVIEKCWFASSTPAIELDAGQVVLEKNAGTVSVKVYTSGGYRLGLITDISPRNLSFSGSTVPDSLVVQFTTNTNDANPYKYNAYGNNDPYPTASNMLGSIEDRYGRLVPSKVRGGTNFSQLNVVHGTTTKPLTFFSASGTQERYSGPVLRGADLNYYMLRTVSGSSVELRRVYNTSRLEPSFGAYEALELYRNTSLPAGTYNCIDLNRDVVKNATGKFVSTIDANYIYIGTTSEAIAQPQGATYGSPTFWNAQINRGYNWYGTYWAWGPDWFGAVTDIRAIGTAAQRPATPAVDYMVYYATDTATYSKWENSAWGSYTPLF